MSKVPVTINLPKDLVERAKKAGLLTDEKIEKLISQALRRTRTADILDSIGELDIDMMTTQEIATKISRKNTPQATGLDAVMPKPETKDKKRTTHEFLSILDENDKKSD